MRYWIWGAIPCALAVLLVGCALATPTSSPIQPLALKAVTPAPAGRSPSASSAASALPTSQRLPTPTMVVLPTPRSFRATVQTQEYQGLRFSLEQVRATPGAAATSDVRYVVVTVLIQNASAEAKDLIGLPMSVSLREVAAGQTPAAEMVYLSQPYAPSAQDNLYEKIDQLSTTSAKRLAPGKSLRGNLYFQVPRAVRRVEVVWKPAAPVQWLWGPFEVQP